MFVPTPLPPTELASTFRVCSRRACSAPHPAHPPHYPSQVNLKSSIYLLSIENEMLKKATGGSGGGTMRSSAAALSGGGGAHAVPLPSATQPPPTTASLLSSELPSAEFPSEIGDAFEVMRQKYTQVCAL